MPLYAALSCFQGDLAHVAAQNLLDIGFEAIQLTPGCAPSRELAPLLESIPTRTHHGWAENALRRRVWDEGSIATASDSIHPPLARDAAWLWDADVAALPVMEVMYPSYTLGTGAEFRDAMERGMRLAVDVSHLWIQLSQGACTHDDIDTLLAYEHIEEIHVSANDGARDSHLPVSADAWGLGWASERRDLPVVFEGYLHRLTEHEQHQQFELLHAKLA
jgi:hypothetical protein